MTAVSCCAATRCSLRWSSQSADAVTDADEAVAPPPNTAESRSEWVRAMQEKYGEGTFNLFRPLYRDLVDEVRREAQTKPPAPHKGWSVEVSNEQNVIVARKAENTEERTGRVLAYTHIKVGNPPKLHQGLLFVDFFPVEVLVERNGVVLHFSTCAIEGQMHLRNVRVHKSDALGVDTHLLDVNPATLWARHNLLYDGPCLWHIETDMQSELHEIMMDHGVDMQVVLWLAEWAHFAEHAAAVRWMLGLMEAVLPEGRRGGEDDFLTVEEMEELSKPAEEWLAARFI